MPTDSQTPSDPITAAIENSIAEATDMPDPLEGEDTGGADETPDDAGADDVVPDPAAADETPVEGVESPASGTTDAKTPDPVSEVAKEAAKKDAPKDELEAELEALGLGKKDLKPGERENRIPYSRTRKIVGNAIKRANERVAAQVKEHADKVGALETEIAPYREVDRLIVQDPEKYVQMLAAIYPKLYAPYVGKGTAKGAEEAPKSTVPEAKDDPEPKPDYKFEDGTMGYTPEQHAKLLTWNHRQGVREAETRLKAELDTRMKPYDDARKKQEDDAAAAPRVQGQKEWATKTFGKLWQDDYAKGEKSEILAVMKANDGQMGRPYLSFEAAVAQVLVPKQAAERNSIRASVIEEMNARPAAAVKTPAVSAKTPKDEVPKTMEEVIKESLVAAGLLKR